MPEFQPFFSWTNVQIPGKARPQPLDFSSPTENCQTTDATIFVRPWPVTEKIPKIREVYLKVLLLPRTEYFWFR